MSNHQIEISAQVWVCNACGCRDNKSCSCDSSAYWKERAATKREATRQRVARHREKAKEIKGDVTRYTAPAANEKVRLEDEDELPDRDGEVIQAIVETVSQMRKEVRERLFAALRKKFGEDDAFEIPPMLRRTAS